MYNNQIHWYFLLKKWEKLLHCKSFSYFFNKKHWHISDINVWNFNGTLTNYVVSFEQPCPGIPPYVSSIFSKGDRFVTSCLLPWMIKPSIMGSILKGKNLLFKKKEFVPIGTFFFPLRVDCHWKGRKNWLVGCFEFNGPLRQYFSLYRAVSQREGERGEKG